METQTNNTKTVGKTTEETKRLEFIKQQSPRKFEEAIMNGDLVPSAEAMNQMEMKTVWEIRQVEIDLLLYRTDDEKMARSKLAELLFDYNNLEIIEVKEQESQDAQELHDHFGATE